VKEKARLVERPFLKPKLLFFKAFLVLDNPQSTRRILVPPK